MRYELTVTAIEEWLWSVDVIVLAEDGTELLHGQTRVACETEAEANLYGEEVFMRDLRNNYPRLIGDLVLHSEEIPAPEEVVPEEEIPAPEGVVE